MYSREKGVRQNVDRFFETARDSSHPEEKRTPGEPSYKTFAGSSTKVGRVHGSIRLIRHSFIRTLFTDVQSMYSREKGVRQDIYRLFRHQFDRLTQNRCGQTPHRPKDISPIVR